jgi:hypothetical protein
MLTKSFLVSSLFLVGCNFPTLSVPVCGIIKPQNNQWYFYCQMSDDSSKEFNLPLEEPMVCTTVEGYEKIKKYIEDIKLQCKSN